MKRSNTMLFLFLIAVVIVLIPAMAWAQTAEPEPAPVLEIGQWLVSMAVIVVLGAVGWVAVKAGGWIKAKTGLDTEVLLRSLGESAASLAEEKARQYTARASEKLAGHEKLNIALDFARDRAKEMKLDKKAEAKLRSYIEAHLGAGR